MTPVARGHTEDPVLLSVRHYRWLASIYAALACFASLVPLHYSPIPLDEAFRRFREVCAEPIRLESLSDWVANIALFTPLGYLLTAAFALERPRVGLLVAAVVVAGCALLSASIEFTQLYFPPRVSSLNDVVAESIGAALGATAWLAVGRPLTLWARRDEFGLAAGAFPVEFLPCCLLLLTVDLLLPLDLTLQPGALYHKYKAGGARLAFFVPWPGAANVALRELPNIFLFLPVGLLLSGLGGDRWREWAGWRWVLGLGLLLAGSIKFLQLFVLSRNSFALDVLSGGLAILLGWTLGMAVRKFSPAGTFGASHSARRPRSGHFLVLLAVWAAVVAFLNWHPFDPSPDLRWVAGRLAGVSPIPFADYVAGDYFHALDQVISRLALFLPAGLILPLALGWETNGSTTLRVVLHVAAWAIVIEVGQAFLPTRYPSVSDVLVESLGAWFGYSCARRLRAGMTTDE